MYIQNKSVISLDTTSIIGTAVGVTLNKSNKRIKSVVIKSKDEEELFLDVRKITGINDYITAKQKDISSVRPDGLPKCDFDTPIIDNYGKLIGYVKDIIFDEIGNVIELSGSDQNIDDMKIIGISDDFIMTTFADASNRQVKNTKISIPSIDINDKLSNYRYLLNKVVTKTIVDSYMTPIILRNTLVTKKVIELAAANGKIIDLILNTN